MRRWTFVLLLGACVSDRAQELGLAGDAGGSESRDGSTAMMPSGPAITGFECSATSLNLPGEPVAIATLPGPRDFVAVLLESGMGARVELRNPEVMDGMLQTFLFPAETARALHAFYYELPASRPALAIVTSARGTMSETPRIRVYEWRDNFLTARTANDAPLSRNCSTWACNVDMPTCPDSMEPCGCRLDMEFLTEVALDTSDLDRDGLADLAIGTSSDLPLVTYFSSDGRNGAFYEDGGCSCGRYAQPPGAFVLGELGGDSSGAKDLLIGAAGGLFVRYGAGDELMCGASTRIDRLSPVRSLARGHFQCAGCDQFDDFVVVSARSLGGGSFDDPGNIRVLFGTAEDATIDDEFYDRPGASLTLTARELDPAMPPRDPRDVVVGDLDGDDRDDVAVLFRASREVHVWQTVADRELREAEAAVQLGAMCEFPSALALADLGGDGVDDLVMICDPTAQPRLIGCAPRIRR